MTSLEPVSDSDAYTYSSEEEGISSGSEIDMEKHEENKSVLLRLAQYLDTKATGVNDPPTSIPGSIKTPLKDLPVNKSYKPLFQSTPLVDNVIKEETAEQQATNFEDAVQNAVNVLKEQLRGEYEDELKRVRDEQEHKLKEVLDERDHQVDTLERKVNRLNVEKHRDMEIWMERVDAQKEEMSQKYNDISHKYASLSEKYVSVEHQLSSYLEENANLTKQLGSLQNFEAYLEDHFGNITELRNCFENNIEPCFRVVSEQECLFVENKVVKLETEIKEKVSLLETIQIELKNNECLLEESNTSLKQLESDLAKRDLKIQSLEESAKEAQLETRTLNEEKTQLKHDLEEQKQVEQRLSSQLIEKDSEIERVKKQLAMKDDELSSDRELLSRFRKSELGYTEEISKLKIAVRQLEVDQQQSSELATKSFDLQSQLNSLTSQIETAQRSESHLKEKLQKQDMVFEELNKKYNDAMSEKEALSSKMEKLNEKCKQLELQYDDLYKDHDKCAKVIANLKTENETALAKSSNLEEVLSQLKEEKLLLMETMQEQEENLKKLSTEINSISADLSVAQQATGVEKLLSAELTKDLENYKLLCADKEELITKLRENCRLEVESIQSKFNSSELQLKALQGDITRSIHPSRYPDNTQLAKAYVGYELNEIDKLAMVELQNLLKNVLIQFELPYRKLDKAIPRFAQTLKMHSELTDFANKIHVICYGEPLNWDKMFGNSGRLKSHLKTLAHDVYHRH